MKNVQKKFLWLCLMPCAVCCQSNNDKRPESSQTVQEISQGECESSNDSILIVNEPESETGRLIREVRQQYNDSMLVSEMLRFCKTDFQNLNNKDLAILFNYMTSCWNEESSEAIYCDIVENINTNETFSHQLIQFVKEIPAESKDTFIEQMANNIVWAQSYCAICTKNYIDSLSKCIIDRMPKDIFEQFYNCDTMFIKDGVNRYVDVFYK